MGRFGRKPALPQRLFPLRHMNWDAGTGCGPGPSPTAWGSSLTEPGEEPPGCHYLPCPSISQSWFWENRRAAAGVPSSGTKAMLPGLGFLGKMSRQAAWAPSGSLGISYGAAFRGGPAYCLSQLWEWLCSTISETAAWNWSDQMKQIRVWKWRWPVGALTRLLPHLYNYLFKVQTESPEIHRVPLFLKCRNCVNQSSKNKQPLYH